MAFPIDLIVLPLDKIPEELYAEVEPHLHFEKQYLAVVSPLEVDIHLRFVRRFAPRPKVRLYMGDQAAKHLRQSTESSDLSYEQLVQAEATVGLMCMAQRRNDEQGRLRAAYLFARCLSNLQRQYVMWRIPSASAENDCV